MVLFVSFACFAALGCNSSHMTMPMTDAGPALGDSGPVLTDAGPAPPIDITPGDTPMGGDLIAGDGEWHEVARAWIGHSQDLSAICLELDGELGDTAFQALEKRWARAHRGAKNAGKIAILEAGVKFKPLTMSNADAQYIQSRNMSAVEVARIHRVPASMIDASSGQSLTYRTVESDGIHLERYSLNPWMVRIEQALMRDHDLFPGAPDSYPQFLRQALLRSDSKTRAEFYAKALDPVRGWMDRAEVREAEDLPPETVTQTPTQVRKSMAALLPAGKGGHD